VGNGLDFKVGAFDPIIGYEVFDSGSNPNFSRSYGYGLEPVQHVGVLASYRVSDMISFSAGVADSAAGAQSLRAESIKTYMASVTLTAPEALGPLAGSTLYAGIIDGSAAAGASKDTTWLYAGATIKTPWEQLSLGTAFDYRFAGRSGVTGVPVLAGVHGNPNRTWAYAVAGYASYQVTEKLKWNNRVDYSAGTDGTYSLTPLAIAAKDSQDELLSVTSTFDYSLWENVISRAEIRWDHDMSKDRPFGISDRNALSLAANIIYKF
jgi:hypothetical protein